MSSSSEGELEIDVGDIDDSICIVCNSSTYVGETIACETCQLWFHFNCVGVKPGDDVVEKEDVPFFCPKCKRRQSKQKQKKKDKDRNKDKKKTTAKAKAPTQTQQKEEKAKRGRGRPPGSSTKALPTPKPAVPVAAIEPLSSPPIKLKISFGKVKATEQEKKVAPAAPRIPPLHDAVEGEQFKHQSTPIPQSQKRTSCLLPASEGKRRKTSSVSFAAVPVAAASSGGGDSDRDEEERWLDAVEAGKDVSTVDSELKSIKDPKLMTARQRAMIERQNGVGEEELSLEASGHMALDYGYKKKATAVEDDEDAIKLKAEKSAKRKEIELEKRELDKQKTMDKLLKKKDTKTAKHIKSVEAISSEVSAGGGAGGSVRGRGRRHPTYTYKISMDGATISVPEGFEFPMLAKGPISPPKTVLCSIPGCKKAKVYNCSKSGNPLCSYDCYKKNAASFAAGQNIITAC
jgi:INO80 complex subunit B